MAIFKIALISYKNLFCFLLSTHKTTIKKMVSKKWKKNQLFAQFYIISSSVTHRLLHRLAAPQVSLLQPLPARFARRPNFRLSPRIWRTLNFEPPCWSDAPSVSLLEPRFPGDYRLDCCSRARLARNFILSPRIWRTLNFEPPCYSDAPMVSLPQPQFAVKGLVHILEYRPRCITLTLRKI